MRSDAIFSTLAVLLAAGSAQGAIIDLTQPHSSGAVNGSIFESADFRPAGTGYIDSFVRVQANGVEQGYNTSGTPHPFDEKGGNFTRNLRLGDVGTVTVSGNTYYEFRLDINESNGGGKNLLSLDSVQIYTSPVGSQTTTNVSSLGALRYDLDAGGDSWIKMDYNLNSGSGQGDMAMLVPVSKFAGAAASDFVYLYSKFGVNYSADAGFEEWAVRTIPAPGPVVVAGIGAMLMVGRRRKTA
jgi:hypothetical protein